MSATEREKLAIFKTLEHGNAAAAQKNISTGSTVYIRPSLTWAEGVAYCDKAPAVARSLAGIAKYIRSTPYWPAKKPWRALKEDEKKMAS